MINISKVNTILTQHYHNYSMMILLVIIRLFGRKIYIMGELLNSPGWQMFVYLFSGLGLFLYGMNLMSEGLEKAAGNKLKAIVGKLTTNRYMGVAVGAFVTAIVQSSSASTVMVVGFVNAGIMNLTQAIGVIMGANIGTTMTSVLVALKLTDLAPFAIGFGVGVGSGLVAIGLRLFEGEGVAWRDSVSGFRTSGSASSLPSPLKIKNIITSA